jgi:hypothetical protein
MIDLSQVVYAIGRIEAGNVRLLGTAFAVSPTKVATAFHVPGADDRNLVLIQPRVKSILDYQDTSDTSVKLIHLTLSAADPLTDLCVLELQEAKISFSYSLGSTDETPTGAPVITLSSRLT